jgi:hypothetical protein
VTDLLWLVKMGNVVRIVSTVRQDREEAKRNAARYIGGNPDRYTVTPLTSPGDRVSIDVTLSV